MTKHFLEQGPEYPHQQEVAALMDLLRARHEPFTQQMFLAVKALQQRNQVYFIDRSAKITWSPRFEQAIDAFFDLSTEEQDFYNNFYRFIYNLVNLIGHKYRVGDMFMELNPDMPRDKYVPYAPAVIMELIKQDDPLTRSLISYLKRRK